MAVGRDEQLARGLAFLREMTVDEFRTFGPCLPDSRCDIAFRDWRCGRASHWQRGFLEDVAKALDFSGVDAPARSTPEDFARLTLFELRTRSAEDRLH